MPWRVRRCREWRVSSARMAVTPRSVSIARRLMSPRLPMGVLTTCSRPACASVTSWGFAARVKNNNRLDGAVPSRRKIVASETGALCVLGELALEVRLGHRADDRINVLPVLEEQDARDGPDVEPHRGLLIGVDVDLRHLGLSVVFRRELIEYWRDHATRAAPGRPEVHYGEPLVVLDLGHERRVRHRH